jgi:predicted HAD superfamily phosphohydrolase
MRRDLHVFRALSPASYCDLLVSKRGDSRICRVEVRTGQIRANGKLAFGFAGHEFASLRFDLLAVVVPGGIVYEPSVEDWFAGRETSAEAIRALRNDTQRRIRMAP